MFRLRLHRGFIQSLKLCLKRKSCWIKNAKYRIKYGSNNFYQISSKDIKTGCSNIKFKSVLFIIGHGKKRILECISPARVCCNISSIPSVI